MKPRTALHVLVGTLVAVALIFFASNLQAGSGSTLAQMADAQRHTPVLWVVDVCAIAFLAGVWWVAVLIDHFQNFVEHQARQHHEQLDDMIERTTELEQVNDTYCDRIERLEIELARQFRDLADQISTLEAAADARRKVFEMETRRISEHAYRLFEAQLQRNTSQVEAVQIALQFQRSELRRLRQDIRELRLNVAPQQLVRLSPADLAAISPGPLAIESFRSVSGEEFVPSHPDLSGADREDAPSTDDGGESTETMPPAPISSPVDSLLEDRPAETGTVNAAPETEKSPDWRSGGSDVSNGSNGKKSHTTGVIGNPSALQSPAHRDFAPPAPKSGPNRHPLLPAEPGVGGHRPENSTSNAAARGPSEKTELLADHEAIS